MRFCLPRSYAFVLFLFAPVILTQTVASPPVPVVFPTGAATPLGQQVAVIAAEPAVSRAHWGIAITALDGTPIYGLNEGEFFRPASNNKLFTTAAAMHLLGPSTHVTTTVVTAGEIDKHGTLKGDLLFTGRGDANLSGRSFPYLSPAERKRAAQAGPVTQPPDPLRYVDELADGIAKKGVKRITGDIVGDDSVWPWEPYANDWSIDDAVWGYGAPVSALTVTDNQLELTVNPASTSGKPATVTLLPETGYYVVQTNVETVAGGSHANIRIDREIGSRIVRARGTVAIGEPYSTEIAIENPAEFAAQALKKALEARGIRVDGRALPRHKPDVDLQGFSAESRTPILTLPHAAQESQQTDATAARAVEADHVSPSLADDVTLTLKVSQNLHAELLLRRLGAAYGTDGSTAQGARVVRQFLLNAGLDGGDFIFYDGSGLSGHDLVTPRATAKLLMYATTQPWFAQWKAGLPVGGEDGTLAGRFSQPPLKDHLFAKTGTLSEARALSGYLDCASGKTVIFSIMVDNHAPNAPGDRDAMDRIVAAIAQQN
ncbi:MAG: D-alanyl-D-alanine carboxypeptidase/D-alanyl-D-alanine-endopeptidase [Acidobacteriaceae bacterium]